MAVGAVSEHPRVGPPAGGACRYPCLECRRDRCQRSVPHTLSPFLSSSSLFPHSLPRHRPGNSIHAQVNPSVAVSESALLQGRFIAAGAATNESYVLYMRVQVTRAAQP